MLRLQVGLMAVALLALVACTLPPADVRRGKDTKEEDRGVPDPPSATSDAKQAAGAINAFATDLYAQLRTENGNLIVSPYSIGVALAMTRAGAEGNTASELDAALHIPVWGKTSTGRACPTAAGMKTSSR